LAISRSKYLAVGFLVVIAVSSANPQIAKETKPANGPIPSLVNTCLITDNVDGLVQFYDSILLVKAQRSGKDYAEFHTGVGVLAIFSAAAQEKYKSVILEFSVADVDREYARLQGIVKTWVKPPTTQPWGTRSIYFRDPDGNLIDLYTPQAR
jgi:catechol 2,3-dioxygenase-like lactoylglutathione lyase family enzyme